MRYLNVFFCSEQEIERIFKREHLRFGNRIKILLPFSCFITFNLKMSEKRKIDYNMMSMDFEEFLWAKGYDDS